MYLEEATIVEEKYKRGAGLDIVILLRKRGAPMCRPIATRLHVIALPKSGLELR